MSAGPRPVPFTEVAAAPMSRNDDGERIVVATSDTERATLAELAGLPSLPGDRTFVAAFQGEQRTGGHAITITAIERDGDRLLVRAMFSEPPPGSFVTQVITSPVHVVSIARADAAGVRSAVLHDGAGSERARATVP